MSQDVSLSLWCEEAEDAHSLLGEDQEDFSGVLAELQVQVPVQVPVQTETSGPCEVPAAWDPSLLGHRAVQRLLQLEQRYMPSLLYVSLMQSEPHRREQLVKWAMEVSTLSNLLLSTLSTTLCQILIMSTSCFDRLMLRHATYKELLQAPKMQ